MIIKYILDKTPQSLNVLSSNLHSAEILIKSTHRLIVDSVDLHVGADFGLFMVQIVQDISKVSVDHLVTYIYQNENLELCGA